MEAGTEGTRQGDCRGGCACACVRGAVGVPKRSGPESLDVIPQDDAPHSGRAEVGTQGAWTQKPCPQSGVWALRGVDGVDSVDSQGSHCHQEAPDVLTHHMPPVP